jgi:stringent starvation protein B
MAEIVLNLNYAATKDLHIDNEAIVFSARFNGVSQNLYVPMGAVKGIFARENAQGMFFETSLEPVTAQVQSDEAPEKVTSEPKTKETTKKKPTLTIVK